MPATAPPASRVGHACVPAPANFPAMGDAAGAGAGPAGGSAAGGGGDLAAAGAGGGRETAAAPAGLARVAAGPALSAGGPPGGWGPLGGWGRLAGSINLTVPLATLLGESAAPGEVAGFGPVPAAAAHQLAHTAAASPAMRWCVTVTDANGAAAGHGCAPRAAGNGPRGAGRRGRVGVHRHRGGAGRRGLRPRPAGTRVRATQIAAAPDRGARYHLPVPRLPPPRPPLRSRSHAGPRPRRPDLRM
jgi:hypothetical protein